MKKKVNKDTKIIIREEYLFVIIGLTFGIILAFVNPPFQSNDEDRHFYKAYMIAEGQFVGKTYDDGVGFMMPKSIYDVANAYQGVRFSEGKKIKRDAVNHFKEVKLNSDTRFFYKHPSHGVNPVGYFANSVGIFIGKIIDSNPISMMRFSRIFGVIFYVTVVFFAVKLLPVFKSVLMLLALSPMSLYIASSVTTDLVSLSLAYLLIALIIRYSLKEGKLTINEILILLLVAFFHRFAKDNYWLLGLLIFIIPKSKFPNKFYYLGMIAYFVILIPLPGFLWNNFFVVSDVSQGGKLQTDFLLGGRLNFQYHLENPMIFVQHIFLNIAYQGKEWLFGALGRFGYAYYLMPDIIYVIHIITILSVALLDKVQSIRVPEFTKYYTLFVGLFFSFAIIAGYFIIGSPVGAKVIFGLQGRYFTPIIILFTFALYNLHIRSEFFESRKTILLGIYSVFILSVTTYFINNYFYGE